MKRRYDLLYAIGALLSSPILAFGLLRTGKWRTDWKGRFGKAPVLPDDSRRTVLLHGVSVGEINATRDLVSRLADSPSVRVVVSATTNTGFERARDLYAKDHSVVRFPFDFSWMVGRFLQRVRPHVMVLMELEVWPNLAQECRLRQIPLLVVNGRLSDSSFGTYRWAKRWVRPMFEGLTAVAAQTEEYAERFRELGTPPERVSVTDTMKWDTVRLVDDVPGAEDLRAAMGVDPSRPLIVAGSTGPGEEELLMRGRPPGVQLMLVPRKPERFDEVARLAPDFVRRSQRPDGHVGDHEPGQTDLFLVDTMGELTKAYALSDVAVVGRSFVPLGGSDPIEPVALGKPTLIGPRHENFRDVVSALVQGGGVKVTERPMEDAAALLENRGEAQAMAEAGRAVIRARQGATDRHVDLIMGLLDVGGGGTDRPKPEVGRPSGGGHRPWSRLRRFLFLGLFLYLAIGYLTTSVRWKEAREGALPTLPLPAEERQLLSGVFSVHTGRSHDARGTREQVAAAAVSAGLDFVVVGDHPPDDRRPDWALWEPSFYEGVLVDGGLELRAPEAGKVLAMGVDSAFRRWTGDLGSFRTFLDTRGAASMVVHGRGPRESERWIHGGVEGIQGWEALDISESARDGLQSPWGLYHLITVLVGYPLGLGDEALLHMMRRGFDTPTVAAYDSLRLLGPLTATAGLNVHPKISVGPVLAPAYGPFFRTLVSHLPADDPLPLDPTMAQERLAEEIRQGDLFISLGDTREAGGFRLSALTPEGGSLPMGADGLLVSGLVLRGGFDAGGGEKMVYRIMRDGVEVEWVMGPELEWKPTGPGVYRVEVYRYTARLGRLFFRLRPWIFANPMGLR